MSNSEVLLKVENASKKFCRTLKKSLSHGIKDLGGQNFLPAPANMNSTEKNSWQLAMYPFTIEHMSALL